MSEAERVYDEQIAPELLRLSQLATEVGLPLLCVAALPGGNVGLTNGRVVMKDLPLEFVMALYGATSKGNLDLFVIKLLEYCEENRVKTDASMVARILRTKVL